MLAQMAAGRWTSPSASMCQPSVASLAASGTTQPLPSHHPAVPAMGTTPRLKSGPNDGTGMVHEVASFGSALGRGIDIAPAGAPRKQLVTSRQASLVLETTSSSPYVGKESDSSLNDWQVPAMDVCVDVQGGEVASDCTLVTAPLVEPISR